MSALDARSARRRYLILIGLRWLPTGLLIPVTVLLADLARPVADRDRPHLQPPGAGRAVPRAADGRPVRCARPAARAHRREPGRTRRAGPAVRRRLGRDVRRRDPAPGRLPGARQRPARIVVRRHDPGGRAGRRDREGPERRGDRAQRRDRPGRARLRWPRGARSVRRHPDPGPADPRRARARHRQPDRDPDPHGRASPRPRCRGRGGLDPGRPARHRRRPGAPAHVARAARPRRRGAVLGLRDGHLREPVPDPAVRNARQHGPGGRGHGTGQLGGLVRGGGRRSRGRPPQRSDRRRTLGRAAPDRPGRDGRGDGPGRRADRGGDRLSRLLHDPRGVEPDAHDPAPPRGRRAAPDHGPVDELDDRAAGRRARRDHPQRARRRDLDLDRDDRRRHHLCPGGTALHPGLAGRARPARRGAGDGGMAASTAAVAAATPARPTERRAGTLP